MNWIKFTLIGLSALVIVGCGDARENAVNGMFDALKDGDITKLNEHATSTTSQLLVMGAAMQCGPKQNDFDSKEELISHCLEKMFADIDVENIEIEEITETRARALVTQSNNGKEVTESLDLIKTNDTWKVNMSK
ncbi:MAG: DUF4878 domain-containing protein [Arcobacteraceae bacterium]